MLAELGVHVDDVERPVLFWRLPQTLRCISSATLGGGVRDVEWVLNASVRLDYSRLDPAAHLGEIASALGLVGPGVGLMTAADVTTHHLSDDVGAHVTSTVGISAPTWAAGPDGSQSAVPTRAVRPGTINTVAFVPVRLTDEALVNTVMTITEAKAQAMAEASIEGTGTASDAVAVLCPATGEAELFGGPRSRWGARLARATHASVAAGIEGWLS